MPTAQAVAPKRAAKAPAPPKQKKLFYRIQEVAEMTGLKPYVLRYWETQFKELAPEKDRSDQRRYREADVEIVRTIQDLLYNQKFTIAGARQRLRETRAGAAKALRRTTLQGIRQELCELMSRLSA